ncbi:unnamed protein product [Vicia faba]|uniref:Uncharacterized protein n=1 Tax=Vicia faba TaxID=3906 RepID=A0AAV1B7J4_VICFA|nr:unnamed protein product [Vicia faba]
MSSHKSGCLINQTHDWLIGETNVDVLKSSHMIYVSNNFLNIPIVDKSDIFSSRSMRIFPLKLVSMRNIHVTHMTSDEDSQETNLRNLDGDKDVACILYDMLREPQVYKKNEDHVHEDAEVDSVVPDGV